MASRPRCEIELAWIPRRFDPSEGAAQIKLVAVGRCRSVLHDKETKRGSEFNALGAEARELELIA